MRDANLLAVIERLEGALESAFPDVTPGADDVGPDVDSHDPCP
jgi:hypothetical protein